MVAHTTHCLLPKDVQLEGIGVGLRQLQPLHKPLLMLGSVLANDILMDNYGASWENFSFLKRTRWEGNRVHPCFWLRC